MEDVNNKILNYKKLLDNVILRFTEDINYDDPASLYNVLIEKFFNGDLDDVFSSNVFYELSVEEKRQLLDLGRHYQGLCFSGKKIDNWINSVEDMPIVDYEMISYTIIDNFCFLLYLARVGGKKVLDFLNDIDNLVNFTDKSIIDYLRVTFVDDRVLATILIDMSLSSNDYDIFDNPAKTYLLSYPDGSLYACDRNRVLITSPFVLGVEIFDRINSGIDGENYDLSEISRLINNNFTGFQSSLFTLVDAYREYTTNHDIFISEKDFDIFKDEKSDYIKKVWDDGTKELVEKYNN